MEFDKKELITLVDEKYRTRREFGKAVGWSDSKTNYKLENQPLSAWTISDANSVKDALQIKERDFRRIFFSTLTSKN